MASGAGFGCILNRTPFKNPPKTDPGNHIYTPEALLTNLEYDKQTQERKITRTTMEQRKERARVEHAARHAADPQKAICLRTGLALTGGGRLRRKIVDFRGLGGLGRLGNL